MPLRDIALILIVVSIWGFNFVVIKVGVAELPPLLLTGLRFLFAALPAVLFVRRPAVPWRIIVGYGLVLGVVKFGLLFVAMHLGMPAGLSSLVLQIQAFFTIAFAAVLLSERPGAWQIGGSLVAITGIAVIGQRYGMQAPLLPFLLVIAAAAAWGVANIFTKRAGRVDMLGFIVWSSLVPPLPLFALSLAFEGPQAILQALTAISWAAVASILFLAYGATVLGFGIWSALMSRYPAGVVAPFALLVPVVGMLSGALLLGETLSIQSAAGGLLVIAGLAVNQFGPRLAAALRPG